jgi:uncharacterized protein (TIGR00251 family)
LHERLNANVKPPEEVGTILLQVKVKPNARASSLVQAPDGTWHAKLKSPPVDGKANEELVALVAERFGCRKTAVVIKAGASGRTKLLKVEAS